MILHSNIFLLRLLNHLNLLFYYSSFYEILLDLMVSRFSADLTNGSMSLLLNESNKSWLMINGSMNSQSCMLMTGWKNLDVKLVKGLWEIVHLITGQMHMMSKSLNLEENYFVKSLHNHMFPSPLCYC